MVQSQIKTAGILALGAGLVLAIGGSAVAAPMMKSYYIVPAKKTGTERTYRIIPAKAMMATKTIAKVAPTKVVKVVKIIKEHVVTYRHPQYDFLGYSVVGYTPHNDALGYGVNLALTTGDSSGYASTGYSPVTPTGYYPTLGTTYGATPAGAIPFVPGTAHLGLVPTQSYAPAVIVAR